MSALVSETFVTTMSEKETNTIIGHGLQVPINFVNVFSWEQLLAKID